MTVKSVEVAFVKAEVEARSVPFVTFRNPLTVEEAFARNPAPKVASPPARKVEDAWRGAPATMRPDAAVEDAWDTNPAFKVARLWARKAPEVVRVESTVEEAEEIYPPTAVKRPVVRKVLATDDEAPAENPPEASSVNTDEEAVFWTMRAEPVCPVNVFKVRFEAVVEVAAMVATEFTSAEVVPTARLSVFVWRYTTVPASVHPAPVVIPAQTGFAEAPWVWRNWPEVPGASAASVPAEEK